MVLCNSIMGHNAALGAYSIVAGGAVTPRFQQLQNGTDGVLIGGFASTQDRPAILSFLRSKHNTVGGNTILADNDPISEISFIGADGSNFETVGASIVTRVNGTPATSRMPTDIEFYTSLGGADDDIALSAKIDKTAMLDLYGGTITILAGAENGLKTRTSLQTKNMRFAMPHDRVTQDHVLLMYGQSGGSNNILNIGGGDSDYNGATQVKIFAHSDREDKATGTEVVRIEGGATKALMMGLGNSALRAWSSGFDVLQVGIKGALWGTHADGASTSTFLSNNLYYDGAYKYIGTTSDEASSYEQTSGGHIFTTYAAGTIGNGVTGEVAALTIANDASSTFGGDVKIGIDDVLFGHVSLYGHASPSAVGGTIDLHTGADHDGTYEYYRLQANTDDFWIQREGIATPDFKVSADGSSTFGGDVIMADEKSIQTGTAAADFFSLETYNTNDASRSVAIRVDNSAVASDTALIGFYGATPVNQPKKADNNNWTNISDIATALAELGLIDAA